MIGRTLASLRQFISTLRTHALGTRRRATLTILFVLIFMCGIIDAFVAGWRAGGALCFWFLLLFRVYSLITSVVWIWFDGPQFGQAARRSPAVRPGASAHAILPIYRQTGGDFFPFGARAVVLEDWRDRAARGTWRRTMRELVFWPWKLYWFSPAVSVLLVVACSVFDPSRHSQVRALLYAIAVTQLLAATTIAIEAALSYLTFGSWSLAYHRFDVSPQRSTSELATFVGGALTAILGSASAIYVAAKVFSGFSAMGARETIPSLIGKSFYYSLTALTGNGDPGPRASLSYTVMAITYVNAAAFIILVVGLVFDSLGRADPRFVHPRSSARSGPFTRMLTRSSDVPNPASPRPNRPPRRKTRPRAHN